MRAIEVSRFGGPEVLTPADVPDPVPGVGEVAAAGAAGRPQRGFYLVAAGMPPRPLRPLG